ncbi:hypothetical protein BLOT_001319 [Blomia tropicalis]|nr:hypothetical protein BLOT_001319 [Blomia tropicalis]
MKWQTNFVLSVLNKNLRSYTKKKFLPIFLCYGILQCQIYDLVLIVKEKKFPFYLFNHYFSTKSNELYVYLFALYI